MERWRGKRDKKLRIDASCICCGKLTIDNIYSGGPRPYMPGPTCTSCLGKAPVLLQYTLFVYLELRIKIALPVPQWLCKRLLDLVTRCTAVESANQSSDEGKPNTFGNCLLTGQDNKVVAGSMRHRHRLGRFRQYLQKAESIYFP